MNRLILYLLLITYTAGIFKPALPFVSDVIAHTFFYYKHVSIVHSVNGKNHVHNEFIHEAKKDNTPGKTGTIKKMDNTDEHVFLIPNYKSSHTVFSKNQLVFLRINIFKKHVDCNFPPPKFT